MDHELEADAPRLPGRATWFALAMNLLCFAAVPTFWFLADIGVLAWNAEALRWSRLRADPASDAIGIAATDSVTLVRRGCFGECPVYRVTLRASGRVEYVGESFVCESGPRLAVIDGRVASRLISDIRSAGFFDIHWRATDDVSDDATVFTRLSVGGAKRAIRHYHGDLSAPRLLFNFEDAIDEVAGTEQWIPRWTNVGPSCANGRDVRNVRE